MHYGPQEDNHVAHHYFMRKQANIEMMSKGLKRQMADEEDKRKALLMKEKLEDSVNVGRANDNIANENEHAQSSLHKAK